MIDYSMIPEFVNIAIKTMRTGLPEQCHFYFRTHKVNDMCVIRHGGGDTIFGSLIQNIDIDDEVVLQQNIRYKSQGYPVAHRYNDVLYFDGQSFEVNSINDPDYVFNLSLSYLKYFELILLLCKLEIPDEYLFFFRVYNFYSYKEHYERENRSNT